MALLAPQGGTPIIKLGMVDNTQYNYNYDEDGTWKSTNYLELTTTDCWDAPTTATPLNDIQTGVDYLSSVGVVPTYIVMNSTTLNLLTQCEQVQKMFAARQYGVNTGYLDKNTVKSISCLHWAMLRANQITVTSYPRDSTPTRLCKKP